MPADGGIRFGSYVLLRRIARGGMAEVFLAQQRGLEGFDRRVAVKRILPHLADSPDFVKMFLAEAKLAAQLSHPNVVHIYDFGKVDNDYFIAMEYVEGIHSGQAFKLDNERERLSPTLVARIGADAATALHYAHELTNAQGKPLGLVHRDISPANIMVSYDGVVKLCDFGIAKAAAYSDQLTQPGQVKGKYAYMSPEQTVAAPLDGRSDVFSLAIVLWELLSGKTIVSRGDPVEAMRAIRDGKLPPLDKAAPGTPEPLRKAIMWALETKRERRASAADLATALEAFIKASPELAGPMQLAQWVRTRFPRTDSTGPQTAIPVQGFGTSVAHGTMAAPGTQASRILPLTPQTGFAPASQIVEHDDDNSETMIAAEQPIVRDSQTLDAETLFDGRKPANRPTTPAPRAVTPKPAVARMSEQTLIAPDHRAAIETTDRDLPLDVGDDTQDSFFEGETIQQSGSKRPFVPNENAVPTRAQAFQSIPRSPGVAPELKRPQTQMPGAETTMGFHRRLPKKRLYMIGSMFALAMLSFSIVLCVKSPSKRAATKPDAAIVVAADAGVDADIAIADAAERAPTITIDAPADRTTILKVNTRPPGGTVKVGDQTRTAPAELALPAGKHEIEIELEGWQPEKREVDLPYGVDTVLEMAFSKRVVVRPPPGKQMGKLSVRTIPWSDVYIGTRKIGQAPFADMEMPVGKYTLLFKHPSKEPVRRTVTITRNKTTKLSFNL
ncbi:MAG: protein kinase [Myxococcota bacterium]|nr:protein kinase [Myxococcota bacterium]